MHIITVKSRLSEPLLYYEPCIIRTTIDVSKSQNYRPVYQFYCYTNLFLTHYIHILGMYINVF